MKNTFKQLRPYLLLWGTQTLSTLGSSMTGYALILWLYLESGSALRTALLSVSSYAPYIVMSIFAGALSDRWDKKRTMLACDLLAAVCTVTVFVLFKTGHLRPWHLYVINAVNGLMNTIQQPAGEVAATMLLPKAFYQKAAGLRSLSQSLNTILTPILTTALFAFTGLEFVIAVDLTTFSIAFLTLWLFIRIPKPPAGEARKERLLASAQTGLLWLRDTPLILHLILFLACINLVASMYNAALPAMVIPREKGGELVLGAVNTCVGIAALVGSFIAMLAPAPKNRVRVICMTLFFAMSTENFLLAFGRTPVIWCLGAVLGWLWIPLMNANLDVIFRSSIPVEMQGRVYACRNSLQFFTIPAGYLLGGVLVDCVCEPFMAARPADSVLIRLFGAGKGSGSAMLFFVLGVSGVLVCVIYGAVLKKYRWNEPS